MTKDEKFGETYWTKEDIKLAPEEAGVPVTEKNINAVRDSYYATHITDRMIEAGWENLHMAAADLKAGVL